MKKLSNLEKNILIVDFSDSGHHYEYIQHLLLYSQNIAIKTTILLSKRFKNSLGRLSHPKCELIFIDTSNYYVDNSRFKMMRLGVKLKKHVYLGKLIKNMQQTFDEIFYMMLDDFDIFFFPSLYGYPFRGIYFHPVKILSQSSFITNLLNKVRTKNLYLLSRSKKCNGIFILNNIGSVNALNNMTETNKFKLLNDPIFSSPILPKQEILSRYKINHEKYILCHPGAIEARKGSFDILKACYRVPNNILKKCTLLFVGKIANNEKKFYEIVQNIKNELPITIITIDHYIPITDLRSLISASDAILVPYLNSNSSSGIINHSIDLDKLVIGPATGYLGEILTKYNKSILVESNNQLEKYIELAVKSRKKNSNGSFRDNYCIEHSTDNFAGEIFAVL